MKGFSVSDIFPADVSLLSCFTEHRFCDTFCADNASKGLWRFKMEYFCHYQFIRGVVNDSVLSFLCVAELCLCSSSRFGFLLKLSTWLWRLSTVNYEFILQGKLIQYWWLAHYIGSLCPDDLSHWVGDSTISDCTDVKMSHPIPNQSPMIFIRPKEICNLLLTSVNPD